MKNLLLILLIILLSIFVIFAKADTVAINDELDDVSSILPSDLDKVLSTNPNSIPLEKRNQLTEPQLSYRGNDGIPNYLKLPNLDNLNNEELSKAINKVEGTNLEIKALPDGSRFEDGNLIIKDNKINIKELISNHEIDFENNRLFIDGNQFDSAKNLKSTPDGNGLQADSIGLFNDNYIQLINGINVEVYSNDVIKARHADSFINSRTVTTNIDNLNSDLTGFKVDKADFFISNDLKISDIDNSKFILHDDKIFIETSDNDLKVNGMGNYVGDFKSASNESTLIISKNGSYYEISKGMMNFSSYNSGNKFTDAIETNSTVKIEIDEFKFGIKCMTVKPVTTYWYNDENLIRDFGINIPPNGDLFKLCIKRFVGQKFADYDGLIDFIDKNIVLNGTADYLRYPMKDGRIASLLMNPLLQNPDNFGISMKLDNDFVFINSNKISRKESKKGIIKTIAYPDNYYTIKEQLMPNGEIHSIVVINTNLTKNEINQNRFFNYETGYFRPTIEIKGNVITQKNNENAIIILPPESNTIAKILE